MSLRALSEVIATGASDGMDYGSRGREMAKVLPKSLACATRWEVEAGNTEGTARCEDQGWRTWDN